MTMVERIAIALHQLAHPDASQGWDHFSDEWKANYRKAARAALPAMVEPSPAMINAYESKVCEFHMGEALSAKIAWQAMVSAALDEGAE